MDNTASGTRRQDDDTPQSPSPPNVTSKSTNVSQSGSRPATTGLALQARPSYSTMARPDERLDTVAGANSRVVSQRREPRPRDNQTTAHSVVALRGRQVTTEQFDVELDARSRAGKVSTTIMASYFCSWSSPVILCYSLPSMQTTRKTFLRIIITYLPSSHLAYLPRRKLEVRNARV